MCPFLMLYSLSLNHTITSLVHVTAGLPYRTSLPWWTSKSAVFTNTYLHTPCIKFSVTKVQTRIQLCRQLSIASMLSLSWTLNSVWSNDFMTENDRRMTREWPKLLALELNLEVMPDLVKCIVVRVPSDQTSGRFWDALLAALLIVGRYLASSADHIRLLVTLAV